MALDRLRPDAGRTAACEAARLDFLRRFPDYAATSSLDSLRASEYDRLDAEGLAYLDYTGAGLYGRGQVERHAAWLLSHVLANPHSESEASARATAFVERARERIARFFFASPDEYEVIFTPNASGALRLVGESYPFGPGGRFVISADDHNSVNGIREYAHARGAEVHYVGLTTPDLGLDEDDLRRALEPSGRGEGGRFFGMPAQSNMSGVQHPLSWVAYARERGWHVLLDAAAFVPTNRLDLRVVQPDFVPLSLYKLLGYPTGVGCLIARREALACLHRPWFGGGTVLCASVGAWDRAPSAHRLSPGPAGFEDGTLNFLSIPAVEMGLDYLEEVGIDTIHRRVMALTGWLLEELPTLRHRNGRPVVELYGPGDLTRRGAVVLFNVRDAQGRLLSDRQVQADASAARIALRAGCHCNPGVREASLGKSGEELGAFCRDHLGLDDAAFGSAIEGRVDGAVRASLGLASNFADAWRLVQFLSGYRA